MIARFGAATLDSDQRTLVRGGDTVHVTPKAFDLLVLLIEEAPRVVRKVELHQRLWPDSFVSDATLVGLVKEIRRALNDRNPQVPIIRTVHRVGYCCALPIKKVGGVGVRTNRWVVAGNRRIPLGAGENLIGRDDTAAVVLDLPGVSRRHARILVSEHGTVLEDMGSKNGTSIGDQPVASPQPLHDGDRIHIGPIVIIYHTSASGVSTETMARGRPSRRPA